MSPEIIGLIGVAILVVLLFLRVWIGIAMGVVGFLGFAYVTNFKYACMIIGSVPYTSIANETVAAVPLFILMGAVVSNTGVGGDLYQTAYKWRRSRQVYNGSITLSLKALALLEE